MVGGGPTVKMFTCPNCQALYQVVKVECGLETIDRDITCRSCGALLPGRENNFVLKHFMLLIGPH
jgi:transcription elongation factor Elf1